MAARCAHHDAQVPSARSPVEHQAGRRRSGDEAAGRGGGGHQVLPELAQERVPERRAAGEGGEHRRLPGVLQRRQLTRGAHPSDGPGAPGAHRVPRRRHDGAGGRARGHPEAVPGAVPGGAGADEVRHLVWGAVRRAAGPPVPGAGQLSEGASRERHEGQAVAEPRDVAHTDEVKERHVERRRGLRPGGLPLPRADPEAGAAAADGGVPGLDAAARPGAGEAALARLYVRISIEG
mmetsp:Transcript_65187/g.176172  ORF Transcript_65187/g.176172 Transcript_65187/m.176172 type:complete len:235 (-) Transcript_65187:549-1253(-)